MSTDEAMVTWDASSGETVRRPALDHIHGLLHPCWFEAEELEPVVAALDAEARANFVTASKEAILQYILKVCRRTPEERGGEPATMTTP